MRIAILLAAFAFSSLAQAAPPAAKAFDPCAADKSAYVPIAKRSAHAVLFRIDRCGQPESYILGSIHSDDHRALAPAAPALALLPSIAAAGFEYLEPENAEELVARTMFDPRPNAKLSSQLSEVQWRILRERLANRRGMQETAIQRLKPWAAAVMLQVPESHKGGQILDDMLKSQAQAQSTRLFGLETMEDQLSIFDRMPEDKQWAMLKDTLASLSSVDLTNAKLMQAYAAGDLDAIERLGEEGFAEIKDEGLRRYLQESLIIKRNASMAERMQLELTGEPVLTVVGALHLPGKDGILQRLERAGYYIFPVERAVDKPAAKSSATPTQGH